jgi:hypothetical protein
VQGRLPDRWEHHVTDRAIRLRDRGFGQFIEEGGFTVDVLHSLEQFFDDFLLSAHGNPMHHLQQEIDEAIDDPFTALPAERGESGQARRRRTPA